MTEEKCDKFEAFSFNEKLLKAITELGWECPTPIQEESIRLFNKNGNIVARGRTGSGKTGAYLLPIINRLMRKSERKKESNGIDCLILLPSKELCHQVMKICEKLMTYSRLNVMNGTICSSEHAMATMLKHEPPNVLVCTPTKLLKFIEEHCLNLRDSLQFLVIDEADLILTFRHGDSMQKLSKYLPLNIQIFMCSATLNESTTNLKKLLLHNSTLLNLKESPLPYLKQLSHFKLNCENDIMKFTILYSLLKLKLLNGKCLIFVRSIDRAYCVRLFLERFKIRSCTLNNKLPLNCRLRTLQQFNDDAYNIIICCNENISDEEDDNDTKEMEKSKKQKTSKKKDEKKKETDQPLCNFARGIDYSSLTYVVHFDAPDSTSNYIHKAGRCARGNDEGVSLLMIDEEHSNEMQLVKDIDKELAELMNISTDEEEESEKKEEKSEEIEDRSIPSTSHDNQFIIFKDFKFQIEELSAFNYRATDVLSSLTPLVIRKCRLNEIKKEIVNSKKLKQFFDEHPQDLSYLRSDGFLRSGRHAPPNLTSLPSYMIPSSLRHRIDSLQNRKKKNQKNTSVKRLHFKKKLQDRKNRKLEPLNR
ncbi:hypothetical protein SNEBB_002305 [Seison nebaliae]|nr:hypothetical protein SNEBB_002305 [Seison nebaliae]